MPSKPSRVLPTELTTALDSDHAVRALFLAFPPSHQSQYAQFVAPAQRPHTRQSRAARALPMLHAKSRQKSPR